MKVIATAPGFHDKLRNVGEEFDVKDGTKGSWFVPVKADPKTKAAGDSKATGDQA